MISDLAPTFGSPGLLLTLDFSFGIPGEATGLGGFDKVTGIITKGSIADFDEFSEVFVLGGAGESTSPSVWLLVSETRGRERGFISTGISTISFCSIGFFAGRGSFFGSCGDVASRFGDDEGDLGERIGDCGDDFFSRDAFDGFADFSGRPEALAIETFGFDCLSVVSKSTSFCRFCSVKRLETSTMVSFPLSFL